MKKVGRSRAASAGLPFAIPVRAATTRIRRGEDTDDKCAAGRPSQRMQGFERRFTDIVDYIVRITDEIWLGRAVGYIYDTYDPSCVIYSSYGVVRTVEQVIASTLATLNAFPDGQINHLAVAWSGNDQDGFYTSHLGHSRSTNVGRSNWGPATGRRTSIHFVADCISRDNRIHTEWLVRDNGAAVRQLGFNPHEAARNIASSEMLEHFVVSPEVRSAGGVPPRRRDLDDGTVEGWARQLFDDVWNQRRIDRVLAIHSPDLVVHAGGGRVAKGQREYQALIVHILAAIPDGVMRVDNVCWADEEDGIIVAVRWVLEGCTAPGGVLGECPPGRPVFMMGMTHMRFAGGSIVEEWMLFDEVGVLVQAYR